MRGSRPTFLFCRHAGVPVEPGDLVASAVDTFRVDVVLVETSGAPCLPVLARRVKLSVVAAPS